MKVSHGGHLGFLNIVCVFFNYQRCQQRQNIANGLLDINNMGPHSIWVSLLYHFEIKWIFDVSYGSHLEFSVITWFFFFHHECYQFRNITKVLLDAQSCSTRHIESYYRVYYDSIWISKFLLAAILDFQHCDSCRHVIKDATSFFGGSDLVLWLLYHKLLFFLMFRCAGCLAYFLPEKLFSRLF